MGHVGGCHHTPRRSKNFVVFVVQRSFFSNTHTHTLSSTHTVAGARARTQNGLNKKIFFFFYVLFSLALTYPVLAISLALARSRFVQLNRFFNERQTSAATTTTTRHDNFSSCSKRHLTLAYGLERNSCCCCFICVVRLRTYNRNHIHTDTHTYVEANAMLLFFVVFAAANSLRGSCQPGFLRRCRCCRRCYCQRRCFARYFQPVARHPFALCALNF